MIFELPDAVEEAQSPTKPKFGIGKLHLLHMCTVLKLSQRFFGGFISSLYRKQTFRYLGPAVNHGHGYGYGCGTSLAIKAMRLFPSNCSSDSYQTLICNQFELLPTHHRHFHRRSIQCYPLAPKKRFKTEIPRNLTQYTKELPLETGSFQTSLFEESNWRLNQLRKAPRRQTKLKLRYATWVHLCRSFVSMRVSLLLPSFINYMVTENSNFCCNCWDV